MIHDRFVFAGQMFLALSALYWFAMWVLKPARTEHSADYIALGNNLSELTQRTLRQHNDAKWESLKDDTQTLADRLHGFDAPTAEAANVLINSCQYFLRAPGPLDHKRQILAYSENVLGALCSGKGVKPAKAKRLEPDSSVL